MKVLMITGDARFGPGNERFELQKSAVEELHVLYWGRGNILPHIPKDTIDVVTAQDPFWRGHLAWHIAWLKGARLNIQVHTDLDAYPGWKRWFALMQLRRATSVRVVSEKIKQQVLALAPRARVFVLPVYIDTKSFEGILRVPHDKKTVLWIGRFEPEKDPLLALDVIKDVPGTLLVMLGAGSLEQSLRAAARGMSVEFAPWQDPKSFLARADVVLCTSRHESFGASIVEALAARVPVVAPDVGIAREAGALVVPRNKLAETLVSVLGSGMSGKLLLPTPSAEEWKQQWLATLS